MNHLALKYYIKPSKQQAFKVSVFSLQLSLEAQDGWT